MSDLRQRKHIRITGIVQGVGFRPFVYGLALHHHLSGFVGNDNQGVFIEVEGQIEDIRAFLADVHDSPPPLSHIESIVQQEIALQGADGFAIVESQHQPAAHTLVSPDLCICPDCLRELFDPTNRRYRYPFINCTNCGPRLTIIQDLPYDRPLTTMSAFPMCPDCAREYHDPLNRRFHAQPNACPVCGPSVWFQRGSETIRDDAAIAAAKAAMARGEILAVKGLGGFHLACDATQDHALQTLRERKGRVDKPFAIMLRDLDAALRLADVSPAEARLLTSRERPIVLLRKKVGAALSELVAPGNAYVGVMLPYTPLHYLLVEDTPLVMTSGNISGDPIVKDNDEALLRLGPLADAFLLHNRAIEVRCDDSVVRLADEREVPIRRSRGYAPFPVKLPFTVPPILAVGGELKATFCVTTDDHALLSQHIGDMENLETLEAFEAAVAHYVKLFRIQPALIACDLHPRYLSTQWAERYAAEHSLPLRKIQHHHAHIAAVMAEHSLGRDARVLGFCFDGTGYGTDGTIWGGEVLLAGYMQFSRLAFLRPVPLPGGDAAIQRPYRIALAHLWAANIDWDPHLPPVNAASDQEWRILRQQLERNINTVPTSSMGRLFDGVSALVGVRQIVSYEAQAAIEFEAISNASSGNPYRFDLLESDAGVLIDPAPVLRSIVSDLRAAVPVPEIGARFHAAVADISVALSLRFREQFGIHQVALSGGVFQNMRLLQATLDRLREHRFEVLHHRVVPPNDGGLALGQAVIAAAALESK